MTVPEWVENREFNRRGLFGENMTFEDAVAISLDSLRAYATGKTQWVITYSGGKDSSALVGFAIWAIETGQVAAPKRLKVLYADTGLELPPLALAAQKTLEQVGARGYEAKTVKAPVENRLYVRMLGYGYPYPTNRRRWCTRLLKKEPMDEELSLYEKLDNTIVLTGVRKGESAARDSIISTSCSTGDGECGQGWYQQSKNALAPLLHWRTCNIWRWIFDNRNPLPVTRGIEDVYRAEHLDGLDIRTGCMKCQVVHEDRSFRLLVRKPAWSWLSPLHELDQVHEWLSKPAQRLRKPAPDKKVNGDYRNKTNPLGPIHIEARQYALNWILAIQARVLENAPAEFHDFRVINDEEEAAIRDMIARNVYPRGWTGNEPRGSDEFEQAVVINGKLIAIQHMLGFEYE